MSLQLIWTLLFATATLALWAVWVGLGHGSWNSWYIGAFPAAACMAGLGYAIGYILGHPTGNPTPSSKVKAEEPLVVDNIPPVIFNPSQSD